MNSLGLGGGKILQKRDRRPAGTGLYLVRIANGSREGKNLVKKYAIDERGSSVTLPGLLVADSPGFAVGFARSHKHQDNARSN